MLLFLHNPKSKTLILHFLQEMYEPIEPIEEMTPSEEDQEEYVDVQPQQDDDLEEYIDVDPSQMEVSTGWRNSSLLSEVVLRGGCVH